MFIRLLLIFVLALNLNAGIFGKSVKKKSVFSSTTSSLLKKIKMTNLYFQEIKQIDKKEKKHEIITR